MKNMEVGEISKVSESSEHKAQYIKIDREDKFEDIIKPSIEISVASITELAEQDSCIKISDFVNNDSSMVEIYKLSVKEAVVSEEISQLVSETCDTVPTIVDNKSSTADFHKPSINGIAVSEEISHTCDTVPITVNTDANDLAVANSNPTLIAVATDSDETPKTFETANGDLCDVKMGVDDDDANTVPLSDKNKLHINEEMNEEDKECNNSFLEVDIKDPTRKEIHWTKRASLPYYREPKPDFFEYTRKLQEKLEPKSSVINSSSVPNLSTQIIVLDEPSNQEPDLLKSSTTSGTYRNKTSIAFNTCLEKRNGKSEKPVSGLIILDDFKSPRIKNSHFSRSSDMWNLSSLNSTKEKPEPVPGAKYKALKEQLMEKIMLKKEESLIKRKAEQEIDEENFEEEEIVSDVSPDESENDLSDDEMEDDSPENTKDDVVLKDMLLKECENFTETVSEETKDSIQTKDSENEQFNIAATIGEDSQEPMECYSLPSYQPGGGFSSSPSLQKRSMKRIFSNSDFNDSSMDSPSQQKSTGRIFSDSDFIASAPSGSSGFRQLKNISSSEFKDSTEEQLPFEGTDEQEIIPHWESSPISERQESQLFDEDISVICSGKFPSTNEDIPWTPSSSVKDSLHNKESVGSPFSNNHAIDELDKLDESDDEELVRPAKKIKLSLVEKLWDSDDENDVDSNDPIAQNVELKGNQPETQSDSDDDAKQDHGPDADLEEDELHDQSEISQKHVNVSFEDSHVKDADNKESSKKFEIKNFFENEAELSGEEGSSDENEDDMDEYMEDDLITDETVASEEKLRKEVGTIHFKRQQDEDEQILRQIKEDFLPEGELYNENGQRKRRYIWNNIGMDDNDFTETKSESEEDEIESLPTDYLKWQQEKNKLNLPEDDDEVQPPKSIGLKVDIIGKVSVTCCSGFSNSSISASPMQRRGSFLNSSIGKNLKLLKEFNSSEGSVSRKNFVFSSPAPQPKASLPSSPASEVKSTRISNIINNRSIFNKI
ncbi:unnamed protein product [Larinioides sclopetarius]|uniref:Claspin n=2 Tax=Larinioides sclopetarius TaxID=280406 RepID=A0AAV1Z5T5_9ARAC